MCLTHIHLAQLQNFYFFKNVHQRQGYQTNATHGWDKNTL